MKAQYFAGSPPTLVPSSRARGAMVRANAVESIRGEAPGNACHGTRAQKKAARRRPLDSRRAARSASAGSGLHGRCFLDRQLGEHRLGSLRLADVVIRKPGTRRDEAPDDDVLLQAAQRVPL